MATNRQLNLDPIQNILIDNISPDENDIFTESEINSINTPYFELENFH